MGHAKGNHYDRCIWRQAGNYRGCLEALEPFIDEVIPEEEEEFDLSVMDYMDSVALELVI